MLKYYLLRGQRADCYIVGNLESAVEEAVDGYYPVVQRTTKAIIANLRVRLSLVPPPVEQPAEGLINATSESTTVRPPRVTLRSKTTGRRDGRAAAVSGPRGSLVKSQNNERQVNAALSRPRPAGQEASRVLEPRQNSRVTFSDSDTAAGLGPQTFHSPSAAR